MFLDSGVRGQPVEPDKDIFTPSGELMKGPSHHREEDTEATERIASVFRARQTGSVEQQLLVGATDNLVAEGEKPLPTPLPTKNDTAAIWITRPLNDTILPLGDVFLTFETHGFTPAVETPIEASMSRGATFRFSSVLTSQNGDTPFLLEKGNSIILSSDIPCTQQVTLYATVRGERVSASVLFSTVLGREAILSARTPLPSGVVWGRPRSMVCPPLIREHKKGDIFASLPKGDKSTWQTHEGGTDVMVGKGGLCCSSGSAESQRCDSGEEAIEGLPRPISLVYVGSLSLDGQKHIWLQQLEQLPRVRFAAKFLTFEEQEGTRGSTAGAWKTNAAESFKQRLSRAGVPLVTVRLPQVNSSWIHDTIGRQAPTNTLKEMAFRTVLESFHRAGGNPHVMSPQWTGEIFQHIADAVQSASPDVLVMANGKTLGDDVLTKAARWAMRDNSGFKIVMDFPNIGPSLGVDVDVIATPSHYVARHPDTQALAAAAGAEVVVIPPGVPVASPLSQAKTLLADELLSPGRTSGELRRECVCDSGMLNKLGCCDPACHVRKYETVLDKLVHAAASAVLAMLWPIQVVGFAGRLAPEKGPGLFMVVAEALAKLIPSAVFIVVGDGPLRTSLEAAAERMGIAR
ncbi:GT4 [Ectocarpus sp. CCAP 1310/34]|nr:GT4 [Ectocarpus sp. CCAP 1310/34]